MGKTALDLNAGGLGPKTCSQKKFFCRKEQILSKVFGNLSQKLNLASKTFYKTALTAIHNGL